MYFICCSFWIYYTFDTFIYTPFFAETQHQSVSDLMKLLYISITYVWHTFPTICFRNQLMSRIYSYIFLVRRQRFKIPQPCITIVDNFVEIINFATKSYPVFPPIYYDPRTYPWNHFKNKLKMGDETFFQIYNNLGREREIKWNVYIDRTQTERYDDDLTCQ